MNNDLTRPATLHAILARFGLVVFPRRLWVGLAVVAITALFVQPRQIFGPYQPLGAAAKTNRAQLGSRGLWRFGAHRADLLPLAATLASSNARRYTALRG